MMTRMLWYRHPEFTTKAKQPLNGFHWHQSIKKMSSPDSILPTEEAIQAYSVVLVELHSSDYYRM